MTLDCDWVLGSSSTGTQVVPSSDGQVYELSDRSKFVANASDTGWQIESRTNFNTSPTI